MKDGRKRSKGQGGNEGNEKEGMQERGKKV